MVCDLDYREYPHNLVAAIVCIVPVCPWKRRVRSLSLNFQAGAFANRCFFEHMITSVYFLP
jgi:hypothetical protein